MMWREFAVAAVLIWLGIASIYGPSISAAFHLVRRIATPTEILERDALARKLGGAEKQW